jgi:NTE family protein
MPARRPATGLVLAGAAALGAYQVGVLRHVATEVARSLGRDAHFDVLSGTSAGAINVLGVASFADRTGDAVERLVSAWSSLELGSILRPSTIEVLRWLSEPAGRVGGLARGAAQRLRAGGLLDARPIAGLVRDGLDRARIDRQVRSGRLVAITVSATHVASGRAVVFQQAASGGTQLRVEHAMASAAIPLLFPAVRIDGDLYCDGGLRHLVPLAPALRLGVRRLLIVSPLAPASAASAAAEASRRRAVTSPLYLAGKALNALFADGLAADLDRLASVNALLAAGRRTFGDSFEERLSAELVAHGEPPARTVEHCHVEPSIDLGALAADYVMGGELARRGGAAARVLRCVADGEPSRVGDLLSYLLFDGGFARILIELGAADARARHEDLCRLLAGPRDMDLAG